MRSQAFFFATQMMHQTDRVMRCNSLNPGECNIFCLRKNIVNLRGATAPMRRPQGGFPCRKFIFLNDERVMRSCRWLGIMFERGHGRFVGLLVHLFRHTTY